MTTVNKDTNRKDTISARNLDVDLNLIPTKMSQQDLLIYCENLKALAK